MRPPARVQAAIELLDEIIGAALDTGPPADRLIADYFKQRRYAGSKDRRAVRELTYRAIRECGPVPVSGRAAMLRVAEGDADLQALFDGSPHAPAAIVEGEKPADAGIAPQWLREELAKSGIADGEAKALLDRAPLDVRVNTLKNTRDALELPEPGEALAAPHALRFEGGTRIEQWDAYNDGRIEVQDHGSQLACVAANAQAGETVIDLCAGAGGKTLALAAAMANEGELLACDTNKRRLSQLAPRAERAGATNITSKLLDPGKELEMLEAQHGAADLVIIDAPCSGTGTWRRNPESRWRMSPNGLDKLMAAQTRLLDIGSALVKPGGRMLYIVCSLLDGEGKAQIDRFLAANSQWSAKTSDLPAGRTHGPGIRLTPHHDGTDGFFIAQLCLAC